MTELYGHKWVSQYGETLPETWCRGLADMSAADIGAGLIACMRAAKEWPPSLPEFRAMCKPPKRENAAAYVWEGLALPHKLSDEQRERGREHIAEMRRKLA